MSSTLSLEWISVSFVLVVALLVALVSYIAMYSKTKKKVANASESEGLSTQYKTLTLVAKRQYNKNTIIFRFALPCKTNKMGLSIGSHVMLKFKRKEDKFGVARPYTPITNDFDAKHRGYFELMIKIYPHGKMTQYLSHLKVGDTMQIKKYIGKLHYKSHGHFVMRHGGNIRNITKIGMIAGGSGITPLLQFIRYAIYCKDEVEINLLFANKTIKDILLRDELEAIHRDDGNKISIHFTVSSIGQKDEASWNGEIGRINADMIRKYTFEPNEDVMMLLCGPQRMAQAMIGHLHDIGHQKSRVFMF
eukprot:675880_1